MFPGRRLHRYTYTDYVALEQQSTTKHEFLDGDADLLVDHVYRASTIA